MIVFTCCLLFAARSGMSDKLDKLGNLDQLYKLDKSGKSNRSEKLDKSDQLYTSSKLDKFDKLANLDIG